MPNTCCHKNIINRIGSAWSSHLKFTTPRSRCDAWNPLTPKHSVAHCSLPLVAIGWQVGRGSLCPQACNGRATPPGVMYHPPQSASNAAWIAGLLAVDEFHR